MAAWTRVHLQSQCTADLCGTHAPKCITFELDPMEMDPVDARTDLLWASKDMESGRRQALNVCVCGAAQDRASLLLHTLAAGDVLGQTQCLRVTLHDSADRASELKEQAIDLHDACYPLLMGVRSETSVLHSLCSSDVVLLILEMTRLEDMVTVIARYATALNQSTRTKQKAVIVAGHNAMTAAGLLRVLAPQLSHHLVVAVCVPDIPHKYSQYGGSYQLANIISEYVRDWWMGVQDADTLTKGVTCHGLSCMPVSCLLPLPTGMTAPKFMPLNTAACLDWEHVKQVMEDLNAAIKCVQLSEADLVMSLMSSKL